MGRAYADRRSTLVKQQHVREQFATAQQAGAGDGRAVQIEVLGKRRGVGQRLARDFGAAR